MAEPSGTGLVQPVGEARGQAMLLRSTHPAVAPLLDGQTQKRHRADVAAGGLLDPRLLVRLPRSGWRSSHESSSSGDSFPRWMMAAPICRRNTEARWLPPPG